MLPDLTNDVQVLGSILKSYLNVHIILLVERTNINDLKSGKTFSEIIHLLKEFNPHRLTEQNLA